MVLLGVVAGELLRVRFLFGYGVHDRPGSLVGWDRLRSEPSGRNPGAHR